MIITSPLLFKRYCTCTNTKGTKDPRYDASVQSGTGLLLTRYSLGGWVCAFERRLSWDRGEGASVYLMKDEGVKVRPSAQLLRAFWEWRHSR